MAMTVPERSLRLRLLRRRIACLAAATLLPAVGVAEWPQFRGPNRDGCSFETGLLQAWPPAGPPLSWRVEGIGNGYGSPVVTAGRVIVTGDAEDSLLITAHDQASGGFLWRTSNGQAWKGPYPGSRSAVTAAAGKLYHLNAHGRLACIEAADGREIWAVDVLERFAGTNIRWGISECVLVDRGRVIVTAGGDRAFLAALDAETGETVWAGPPLRFNRTMAMGGAPVDPPTPDVDRAGYVSPILFEVDGLRLLAAAGGRHFVIAHADNGDLLWTREVPARFEVIGAIPVWSPAGLLFAAPDVGTFLYRVARAGEGIAVSLLWEHPVDNCHGAMVYLEGSFLGSGYRQHRPWVRLDAATGALRYERKDLHIGSALVADGRLYALSERGVLALLEPAAEGFVEHGSMRLAEKPGNDVWSHPAIAAGHLFLRWRDTLSCHDIRNLPD